MVNQVEAAAYHEAGHVIALIECGCHVESLCVNSDGSGLTTPLGGLPVKDEDLVLVGLSGIQAESHFTLVGGGIDDICLAYAKGCGDRGVIETESRRVWLCHSRDGIWHKTQYDRALKFVESHADKIRAIAEAALWKPSFPKFLNEVEIQFIHKSVGP